MTKIVKIESVQEWDNNLSETLSESMGEFKWLI
jgi:hypothetical protein